MISGWTNKIVIFAALMILMPLSLSTAHPDEIFQDEIDRRLDSLFREQSHLICFPWKRFLSENEMIEISREHNIDLAAVKAIIEIETGNTHHGIFLPGKPIIYFDRKAFLRRLERSGIKTTAIMQSHPSLFTPLQSQPQHHSCFETACLINREAAIECTFWGMFQIAGFNWKRCGCSSIDEFQSRMSRSEKEQLKLFMAFVEFTDIAKHIQSKNWSRFARLYNGPSFRSRNYDGRLRKAYQKYSKQQATQS